MTGSSPRLAGRAPRLRLARAGAVWLGATLLLASCRGEARDVLLITVDTLRADHLGLYGYARHTSPRLEEWFARGRVFEQAYATSASTPPSVVSILTGRLPQDHGVRIFYQLLESDLALLPELLPARYQSAAFVSNFVLTDEAIGLARAFDHFDDFVDERESSRRVYERSARRTTDAALAWLREERDPARPLFLWVHYIDPHGPYDPPDDWEGRFEHEGAPLPVEDRRIREHYRLEGVVDALDYVDRYDEEIAYTDFHVGRLLDGYAQTRDVERALVVFSADHGETLLERPLWFRHGFQVFEELVRVPLAIRGPGVESGRVQAPGSALDIVPTVLAFAGAAIPADLDGVDLRGAPPEGRTFFVEALEPPLQWRGAIRGDGKWTLAIDHATDAIRARRFVDLRTDPGEKRPGNWPPGGETGRALLALRERDPDPGGRPSRYHKGTNTRAPKVSPRASDEALERLRALGYVD